jgi:hypothetical protein
LESIGIIAAVISSRSLQRWELFLMETISSSGRREETIEASLDITGLAPARPLAADAESGDLEAGGFQALLLGALARMAARSWRSQADLYTVLRRAGLRPSDTMLSKAIAELERCGFVKGRIPLSDGGLLITVTGEGLHQARAAARGTSPEANMSG